MTDTSEVIVVGGGPVGATAALLLARHGVECTVVEPRNSPQAHPAAHVLSTRSLEIWREVGLEPEILAMSAPTSELRCIVYCTTLAGPELGRVPLVDERSGAALDGTESMSPTRTAHLPQNALEPLLWKRLADTAGVDFRPGWRYVSHEEGAGGVTVAVENTTTAATRTLHARYVIAADGAASAVRRARRVTMVGPVLQHVISVHFSADLEALRRNRRGPVLWTYNAAGIGAFIVYRSPEDLVFHIPYFPPCESPADFPADVCRRHILDAIGAGGVDIDIMSIQSWAMHAQVATNYGAGRVFLAGDAAHRFPPTGGLGLNTGVADVHNLAWKLAWVLDGRAGPGLLDSYDQERRPVGMAATADSVANFEGLFDVVAALGLPRTAVRRLPRAVAAMPRWLPRRPARALIRALTNVGYQRFRLAAWSGPVGERIRQRTAGVIARHGPHYRSGGRDLGVRYHDGAIVDDGLPAPRTDPEFYTPTGRSGGRLPHAWVQDAARRVSTLDLVRADELTLLTSLDAYARWSLAAKGLPMRVVPVSSSAGGIFDTGIPGEDADASLVRPDGHIAAVLRSGRHGAAELVHAVRAVRIRRPVGSVIPCPPATRPTASRSGLETAAGDCRDRSGGPSGASGTPCRRREPGRSNSALPVPTAR